MRHVTHGTILFFQNFVISRLEKCQSCLPFKNCLWPLVLAPGIQETKNHIEYTMLFCCLLKKAFLHLFLTKTSFFALKKPNHHIK